MSGAVIYTPDMPHRCFPLGWPTEAGLFAAVGTRWRCNDCGTVWQLFKGQGWNPEAAVLPEPIRTSSSERQS